MKLGKWPKFPKLHIYSQPQRVKIELIFILRAAVFEIYGLILKIAIFGHETWPLAIVPKDAHIVSFYPCGVKIELIFALQAAISEIRGEDFQNCHIWA